jgi:hypothetical protein
MEKSSQIAWKIVPLRHFFPLKVVPLIEVLLYLYSVIRRGPKFPAGVFLILPNSLPPHSAQIQNKDPRPRPPQRGPDYRAGFFLIFPSIFPPHSAKIQNKFTPPPPPLHPRALCAASSGHMTLGDPAPLLPTYRSGTFHNMGDTYVLLKLAIPIDTGTILRRKAKS